MSRIRADARRRRTAVGLQAPALTLTLAAVLVLAAYTGRYAVVAVVVIAQLVLAAAPAPRDRNLASPVAARAVTRFAPVAAGCSIADALTLWPDVLDGPAGTNPLAAAGGATFGGVVPAVAAVVLVALFAQMLRRDGRRGLVPALSQTVTVGVVGVLACSWVAALEPRGGRAVVVIAAVTVAVAALISALPGRRWLLVAFALGAGAGAGVALAAVVGSGPAPYAAAYGAFVAALTCVAGVVGRRWGSDARRRVGVEAVLPLAVVAPFVLVAAMA